MWVPFTKDLLSAKVSVAGRKGNLANLALTTSCQALAVMTRHARKKRYGEHGRDRRRINNPRGEFAATQVTCLHIQTSLAEIITNSSRLPQSIHCENVKVWLCPVSNVRALHCYMCTVWCVAPQRPQEPFIFTMYKWKAETSRAARLDYNYL